MRCYKWHEGRRDYFSHIPRSGTCLLSGGLADGNKL
jgi:hypothetical protein